MRPPNILPAYTAIFIHFRNPEALSESIAGLLRQSHPPTGIFVVDNSYSEGSNALSGLFEGMDVQIIPAERNLGYAGAVNLARKHVLDEATSHVLVATQDVLWEHNTLAEMAKVAAIDDSIACVGPTLYYRSGPTRVFSHGGVMGYGGRNVHLVAEQRSENFYKVDWMDGAVMFLQVAALESISWMDEDYFLYYEEVDMCLRLRRDVGGLVVIAPSAIAYQEPGNYTPYLRFRNQLLFWHKNYDGWQIWPAIWYQFGRSTLRAFLTRRPLIILWALRGILDGVLHRTGIPPRSLFAGIHSPQERRAA